MTLAIVGGGPTSLAVIRSLSAHGYAGAVDIWEPHDLGVGLVYGETELRSSRQSFQSSEMVIFPDDQTAYLRWLQQQDTPDTATDYPSRSMMGSFLRTTAAELLAAARDGGMVVNHRREWVGTIESVDGGYAIGENHYDAVYLTVGNLPPQAFASLAGHPAYIHDVWGKNDFADRAAGDEPILVIGSGLTSIDVLLGLRDRGYTGEVVFASRNGLLPRVRAVQQMWEPLDIPIGSLDETVRQCRQLLIEWSRECGYPAELLAPQVTTAEQLKQEFDAVTTIGDNPLHRLALGLEDSLSTRWQAWTGDEQRRFDQEYGAYWNSIHLPMIADTAEVIVAEMTAGQLSVSRMQSLVVGDETTLVATMADGREQSFGTVINATGRGLDILKSQNPLLQQMTDASMIRPHPLGGVCVDGVGQSIPGLYVIGVLTRGADFYTYVLKENGRRAQIAVDHYIEHMHQDKQC